MSMSLFACGQSGSKDDGQKKFKVAINCWGQANFFGRAGKEAMEDDAKDAAGFTVARV